jgi:hypothetical protein
MHNFAMRTLLLIAPHWLSLHDTESVLRSNLPAFERFTAAGKLTKLTPLPDDPASHQKERKGVFASLTPEAAWLGLSPHSLALQEGPLMVSALGADPPDGSVHFHLSLLSYQNEEAVAPTVTAKPEDLRIVLEAAKKLQGKKLTIVEGEGYEHGLVWEDGSLDLGTVSKGGVEGKPLTGLLPEGDGEPLLRRLIDDSINLLSSLPLNRERAEEGLPMLNLLWPWGPGMRVATPNLALRRGEVGHVQSSSLRLQGLTRLVGYRHGDRAAFGRGLKISMANVLSASRVKSPLVVVIDSFSELRGLERMEEMGWLTRELDSKLFAPLWELGQNEPLSLTVLAPGGYTGRAPVSASETGLALSFDSKQARQNNVPFDERALEERTLALQDPWEVVASAL